MTLPRDTTATNLVPILLYLRQCLSDPKEKQIRLRLVTLLNRQSGQQFAISEAKDNLGQSYKPVFTWFEKSHPTEAKELTSPGEDEIVLRAIAKKIDLRKSNAIRGEKVFRDRGCQACHGSSIRLGPDLAGAGKRLSRDDLLTALVNPSRDVAPIYRVTHLDTKAGKRLSGILVYDSSETVMIQLANGETLRLPATDIESRSSSNKSLMPDDLLKGIKPGELADLFAYLENR